MPATSRHGSPGGDRSSSGLAGSPSKSMIFQFFTVRSVWPRCRSPCTRWAVTGRSRCRIASKTRAQPVGVLLQLGYDGRARRRGGPTWRRRAAPSCSAPHVSVGKACGQRGVHVGDRRRRAGGPRRRSRRRTPRAWTVAVGVEVAQAGQRQLPAVAGGAEELLQDRRAGGPRRRAGAASPPSRRATRRARCRPRSARRGSRCRGSRPG